MKTSPRKLMKATVKKVMLSTARRAAGPLVKYQQVVINIEESKRQQRIE